MITKTKKQVFFIAILLSLIVLSLLVFMAFAFKGDDRIYDNKEYVLKSHGDFLALYYGDKIVEVYDEIVVSSLPVYDQEQFISGIKIKNLEQLDEILEDFE